MSIPAGYTAGRRPKKSLEIRAAGRGAFHSCTTGTRTTSVRAPYVATGSENTKVVIHVGEATYHPSAPPPWGRRCYKSAALLLGTNPLNMKRKED